MLGLFIRLGLKPLKPFIMYPYFLAVLYYRFKPLFHGSLKIFGDGRRRSLIYRRVLSKGGNKPERVFRRILHVKVSPYTAYSDNVKLIAAQSCHYGHGVIRACINVEYYFLWHIYSPLFNDFIKTDKSFHYDILEIEILAADKGKSHFCIKGSGGSVAFIGIKAHGSAALFFGQLFGKFHKLSAKALSGALRRYAESMYDEHLVSFGVV